MEASQLYPHTFVHSELLSPINHDNISHETHVHYGMVEQAVDPWVNWKLIKLIDFITSNDMVNSYHDSFQDSQVTSEYLQC